MESLQIVTESQWKNDKLFCHEKNRLLEERFESLGEFDRCILILYCLPPGKQ